MSAFRASRAPWRGHWTETVPIALGFLAALVRVGAAIRRGDIDGPGPGLALLACLVMGGLLMADLYAAILSLNGSDRTPERRKTLREDSLR